MGSIYIRKRRLPPVPKITDHDWARIGNEILRAGVAKARLGVAAGITREKLYSMLEGRYHPTWAEGEALLRIREELCAPAPSNLSLF